MKNVNSANNQRSRQPHLPKPEIRDHLDSRKNEEQVFKGNDMTHNSKDTKAHKQKKQG
ncbi:hypothetical protein [Chitinophaga eiseniae]|uniref:Uncharacterized protein n=1 Tax=Chitinophaga eiseniae TaxID=634771 RepID=A0A847SIV4_9BACT|nr:hypothetical protein [Chitinophaga eiseniae]NLR77069.1 hypothetical protein [Chitinophaga eiseniae]